MKKAYLLLLSLLPYVVFSQFSVTNSAPYNSSFYLINNVFAGGNVTISNVNAQGSASQIGFFSGGATAFGIDSGIVLATGRIRDLCTATCTGASMTPAPPGNWGLPATYWMGNSGTNNSLLDVSDTVPTLLGQGTPPTSINDPAIIDFEFVPTKDTMRFKFVFGSSEWNTYPCSQYNDVFGFFVAGPGISGPYNAPAGYPNGSQNFALVPNTNIPITISSITHATSIGSCTNASYSQYYVANPAGSGIGNCNAFTTVMEVTFPVVKCQTYHFSMAIGDGSDGALNSYVFMEANSFDASGITIIPAPNYSGLGGDSILYEGCGGVDIHFERHDSTHLADTVQIGIGGTATNGVDYTLIPDSILFAPGQDTSTISFTVPNDLLIEGNETLFIWVADTGISLGCSPTGDTLMLIISDPVPLTADPTNDTFNCAQAPFTLDANPLTGFPDYTYQWSTGDTSQTISVNNVTQTTNYTVTISDACGVFQIVDTATITIQNPPTAIHCPDDTIDCETLGANIYAQVTDPMPGLTYNWSTGQSITAFYQTNPYTTTDYILTVTQQCAGYHLVDTFTLTVDNPPFTLSTTDDTINCTDSPPTINVNVSYTTPNFKFQWNNGILDSHQVVNPATTTTYTVTVTDACGVNSVEDSVTIYVINDPVVLGTQNEVIPCIGDDATIKVNAIGGYQPYSYKWSTGATDSFDIVQPSKDSLYSVSVTDVCSGDTVVGHVKVFIAQYPPLIIPPLDTIFQKCPGLPFKINNVEVKGGSGNNAVSWNNWVDELNLLYGTVNQTTNFTIKAKDKCNLDSTSTILTVHVPQYDPLKSTITDDTAVCPQDLVTLTTKATGGSGVYTYLWSTGDTDSLTYAKSNANKTYQVTITEECGAQTTNEVTVSVSQPSADFEFDFYNGKQITFKNRSMGGTKYLWNFGDTTTSTEESPEHEYEITKDYIVSLIVKDQTGCIDSASYTVHPPLNIYIPNAFSPNGDGLNDYFFISGEGMRDKASSIKKFSIVILDRWGKEIFFTRDPAFKWDGTVDGKKLGIGTYVYKVYIEGHNLIKYEDVGTITIVGN